MAITFIANALGGTTTTTSFSITLPTTVAGDILILEYTHRGTGDATLGGTYSGPAFTEKHDQLYATSAFSGKTCWSRCTGNHSGQTVTGSGLTDSCAAIVTQYRGCLETGDPLTAATIVGEQNASADETQAAITTTVPGAWVVLVVVNSPDLAVTTQACTSPGSLTARAEVLSTGGTDSSIAHASAEKTAAGATGAFTWAQTNAASGSWAYAIAPTLIIAGAQYTVGTHAAGVAAAQNRTWVRGTPPQLFPAAPVSLDGTGSPLLLTGGTATLESTATTRLRRHLFVGEQDAGRLRAGRALVYGLAVATAITPVSLDGTGGTLTLTGGTATLTATNHVTLVATGGALVLTGGTATLQATAGTSLTASGGALLLSGGTASLTTAWSMPCTGGALLLTGGTASLTTARSLTCTGGTLLLSGGTATLAATASTSLAATGGALILSGGTATLEATTGTTLNVTGGALLLTGGTASLQHTAHAFVIGTGGALVLSGGTATLAYTQGTSLTATGGALLLTGGTASLDQTHYVVLPCTAGHLLLSGGSATLSHTQSLEASGGTLLLSGGTASLASTANAYVDASGGQLILTGGTANLIAAGTFQLIGTGGQLLLSGTTTATLEHAKGGPVGPIGGAGPGPPLPSMGERRRRLIEQEDWIDLAIIIVEIINAGR